MRKIRLSLESLAVESFHTEPQEPVAGTVAAHQQRTIGCEPFSDQPDTCGDTCGRTCQTCAESCGEATCVNCPVKMTAGCESRSCLRCTDGCVP